MAPTRRFFVGVSYWVRGVLHSSMLRMKTRIGWRYWREHFQPPLTKRRVESRAPLLFVTTSTGPHNTALILDPSFHWEPIINLDPSLDPDYESHGLNRNDENLTPWLMVTSPTASSASTNIATTSTLGLQTHIPAQSSRTKADQLAFEEAKKFIKKGRSHHWFRALFCDILYSHFWNQIKYYIKWKKKKKRQKNMQFYHNKKKDAW